MLHRESAKGPGQKAKENLLLLGLLLLALAQFLLDGALLHLKVCEFLAEPLLLFRLLLENACNVEELEEEVLEPRLVLQKENRSEKSHPNIAGTERTAYVCLQKLLVSVGLLLLSANLLLLGRDTAFLLMREERVLLCLVREGEMAGGWTMRQRGSSIKPLRARPAGARTPL